MQQSTKYKVLTGNIIAIFHIHLLQSFNLLMSGTENVPIKEPAPTIATLPGVFLSVLVIIYLLTLGTWQDKIAKVRVQGAYINLRKFKNHT